MIEDARRETERRVEFAENELSNSKRLAHSAEQERDDAIAQYTAAVDEIEKLHKEIKKRDEMIADLRGSYEEESALIVSQFQTRIEELEKQLGRENPLYEDINLQS